MLLFPCGKQVKQDRGLHSCLNWRIFIAVQWMSFYLIFRSKNSIAPMMSNKQDT